MNEVRFLGTTDDVTTCECCGRADLKSTVALSIDGADPVYFGSDCAARAIGRSVAEIKRATKKADDDKRRAEDARLKAKHDAFMVRWTAFLKATASEGHDVFTWIQALGGALRARELFKASSYATEEDRT